MNEYRPVGFNLKNTPFGEDLFNSYHQQRGANPKLKYSDIYTGVIFDKPYLEFGNLFARYPYQKFAIEEEARRKGMTDINQIQAKVGNRSDNVPEGHPVVGDIGPLEIIHLVLFIMGLSIFLSFVFLLKRIRRMYVKS